MKVLGVIAEYNPFHNGHKYHISQAINASGADFTVAVISGSFVQRGEPSFFEKHIRASLALQNGVDLVLELPALFSSAGAEYFAHGGVSALNALGIITHLSFGCENADLQNIKKIASTLLEEPPKVSATIKNTLKQGVSYPRAREIALKEALGIPEGFISKPNNILAIEYLKSLFRLNSSIIPLPVSRIGSNYKDTTFTTDSIQHPVASSYFASASAIRAYIYENFPTNMMLSFSDTLSEYLPQNTLDELWTQLKLGTIPSFNKLDAHILTYFRYANPSEIRKLPYISEGLENKLRTAAQKAVTSDEFFKLCTSARYPESRIRRIAASIFTGVTAELLEEGKAKGVPYIRVLGMGERGQILLKHIKKTASLPIVTKPAVLNKLVQTPFEISVAKSESRATDTFYLSLFSPKSAGLDFKISPIIDC